jgi:hypothetical protein
MVVRRVSWRESGRLPGHVAGRAPASTSFRRRVAVKGTVLFVVAVVLGGVGYWGLDRFLEERAGEASAGDPAERGTEPEAPPGDPAAVSPDGRPPSLVTRPVFFEGNPEPAPEPQAPPRPSLPPREGPAPPAETTGGAAPAPESGLAVQVRQAPAQEDERSLARAVYDSGDRDRGRRLLEELYAISKDRPGVDLSPEVERLVEAETNFARKKEYVTYLARFDRTGRVLDQELARAARKIAAADDEPEAALQAWESLTIAHEVAPDRAARRKVISVLEPFIQRMVFSGRYTPLLKSHMIQSGESLFEIAAAHRTTVDALRRLNGLKSDVIQPRQRLRILPGKVKIAVDKSDFTLWATVDGKVLLEFPVGLGRDNATPTGSFVIRVRQKDPTWWRPGEPSIPARDPRNILGTRWLGFQETQDLAGFGIHGTDDPSSLGKESSAGCVRLRNEDIELLYDFVAYGTEVVIRS